VKRKSCATYSKVFSFSPLHLAQVLLIITSLGARAADARVLITDAYAERLQRLTEEGEKYNIVTASGIFTSRGRAGSLAESAISKIGQNSVFDIRFGEWAFSGKLGSLPTGRKSAKFTLPGGGSVRLAWSKKAVTWSVTAKTGYNARGEERELSPVAASLSYNATYAIKKGDIAAVYAVGLYEDAEGGPTPLVIAEGEMPLVGKAKHTAKKVGKGDNLEEFDLNRVSVKGSANLPIETGGGSGGTDNGGIDDSGTDDGGVN
jgi:hypothetical protein